MNEEYNQIKEQVLTLFTSEARQRFRTIELAHPVLATKIISSVVQAINANLVDVIDDNFLKMLISQLNPKKEFRIIRK